MLDFALTRRTPVILQTEAAECGLACLAMVAGYHGHRIDRRRQSRKVAADEDGVVDEVDEHEVIYGYVDRSAILFDRRHHWLVAQPC